MKKMNVSTKLIVTYAQIIVLALAICVTSLFGLNTLASANTMLYENVLLAFDQVGRIRENFQEQRALIQELATVQSDAARSARAIASIEINLDEMGEYIQQYMGIVDAIAANPNQTVLTDANLTRIRLLQDRYENYFVPELERLVKSSGRLTSEQVLSFLNAEAMGTMLEILSDGYDLYVDLANLSVTKAGNLAQLLSTIVFYATIALLSLAIFLLFYLPRNIARPLGHLVTVADAISVGNMEVELLYTDRGDEVGLLATAFQRMRGEIAKQIDIAQALAQADLSVKPTLRSENDTLGKALITLTQSLNQIIEDVSDSSQHIAQESKLLATQSQELAQGTTEQAASVEQLSSAFFEISLNTKENANHAGKAANLTDGVRAMALEGEAMLAQLSDAVKETATASKSIERIIKAIEEISFQTNILAINAAVEAAHAGQHGSGFAVVASEVRSLASKSADSAHETSALIANAIDKIQISTEMAKKTAASFSEIVGGVLESTRLIKDIAKSSEEQAIAIEQINTGISQVAQVIHVNSAAAEKCAAAAEKMSAQSKLMEEVIARFNTEEDVEEAPSKEEMPKSITIDLSPEIPKDGFGKY